MKTGSKWAALAALAAVVLGAEGAQATTVVESISGSFGSGVGAFTGPITLDVAGGVATSGSGSINILGLTNAPLVLITTSTPGNETAGGVNFPVGFRDNGGTDLFGDDDAFPPTAAGGLLFDVGTTTAVWGQYPLLSISAGAGNSVFSGSVDGVYHYAVSGTVTLGAVPEASTWAMMLLGFAGLGFAGRRSSRRRLEA